MVYGAGGVGVMGAISQAAHRSGARVTGVIPHALRERERAVEVCGEIFAVPSMHERKALMYRLSDAFLVLPGGFGTLDAASGARKVSSRPGSVPSSRSPTLLRRRSTCWGFPARCPWPRWLPAEREVEGVGPQHPKCAAAYGGSP
ncbi:LOG family protein [Streptomyces sp. NPDC048106]|uniref:LOG family protein n=1 Tax=Streptomyces sp. NPDC048106 TaxID=3155750 RepID=UPI0034552152